MIPPALVYPNWLDSLFWWLLIVGFVTSGWIANDIYNAVRHGKSGEGAMSAKMYLWIAMLWVISIFVQGIVQGVLEPGSETDLEVVLSLNVLNLNTSIMGIPVPLPNLEFVQSAWDLTTWNYSWFSGNGQLIRLFILPIAGALAWGFITSVFPTLIAGLNALINFITGLRSLVGGVFSGIRGVL